MIQLLLTKVACYNNTIGVFMKYRYRKLYFEDYAAQTLKILLDVRDVFHREKPDLEIASLEMGIEVTQAIKEDIIFEVEKEVIYTPFSLNPFDRQTLLDKGDISQYFVKIAASIQVKIKKSDNYQKFNRNGLYIFTHCFLLNENNVTAFFQSLPFPITFYDTIYLNGIDTLYCYDVVSKRIQVHSLQSEDLLRINILALQYESIKESEKENARAIKRENAA